MSLTTLRFPAEEEIGGTEEKEEDEDEDLKKNFPDEEQGLPEDLECDRRGRFDWKLDTERKELIFIELRAPLPSVVSVHELSLVASATLPKDVFNFRIILSFYSWILLTNPCSGEVSARGRSWEGA